VETGRGGGWRLASASALCLLLVAATVAPVHAQAPRPFAIVFDSAQDRVLLLAPGETAELPVRLRATRSVRGLVYRGWAHARQNWRSGMSVSAEGPAGTLRAGRRAEATLRVSAPADARLGPYWVYLEVGEPRSNRRAIYRAVVLVEPGPI
jgi:hypothetical protein